MDRVFASTIWSAVPDGPLHPSLAVAGVVIGVSAAAVAGRSTGRWLAFVVTGALFLAGATLDHAPPTGFVDRADRILVIATVAAVAAVALAARMRLSTSAVIAWFGCVGVWAVVPDTEMPLLAGAVLFGAGAVGALPGWLPDRRRALHGILVQLPLAGAAVGSVGRPSRFAPALMVGALAILFGLALRELGVAVRLRQRAGTPTTAVSGTTSCTTTAPAPTTAP